MWDLLQSGERHSEQGAGLWSPPGKGRLSLDSPQPLRGVDEEEGTGTPRGLWAAGRWADKDSPGGPGPSLPGAEGRLGATTAVKKNKIMAFAATRMDLESVIPGEVSQTEKERYSLTCGI